MGIRSRNEERDEERIGEGRVREGRFWLGLEFQQKIQEHISYGSAMKVGPDLEARWTRGVQNMGESRRNGSLARSPYTVFFIVSVATTQLLSAFVYEFSISPSSMTLTVYSNPRPTTRHYSGINSYWILEQRSRMLTDDMMLVTFTNDSGDSDEIFTITSRGEEAWEGVCGVGHGSE